MQSLRRKAFTGVGGVAPPATVKQTSTDRRTDKGSPFPEVTPTAEIATMRFKW